MLTRTVAFLLACCLSLAASAAEPVDFDRDVAPLLARRCFDCHAGADPKGGLDISRSAAVLKGGDTGPAVVAGKLEGSELWARVAADEMPPKKPLTDAEKSILRRWIESGAKWGQDPIDPYRSTTESRAGYDWWSLQPVRRPSLPDVPAALREWTARGNEIDPFVAAKLAEQKLTPSGEADRRTLIRRVTFDLTGLPPTSEEIAAFEADQTEGAYARVVERLLASPHFGERWARHWLDIVRFGESQGFERDRLRTNSWPYRDWVIDAFNRDMPYDEFARLQIAGDILRPGDASALFATGFLVAGAWDEVGQSQQSAAMRAVVRQDELEDIIGTTGQTFLGLTVNCARCHDHKFDPIRQTEYYRLAAALGGVRHGERRYQTEPMRQEFATLEARRPVVERELADLEGPVRERLLAERQTGGPVAPTPFARWDFEGDALDRVGGLNATLHGAAKIDQGKLVLDGRTAYASTKSVGRPLAAKTLEAWVVLSNPDQRGGGVITVQTPNGGAFDSIVFGEREPGHWMAGSEGFSRFQSFQGTREIETGLIHVAIVYSEEGTITAYRNGLPYGKPYRPNGALALAAGDWQVLLGLRHGTQAGGDRLLAGAIETAQLYDRALAPEEVAASAGRKDVLTPAEIAAAMTPAQQETRKALMAERQSIDSRLKAIRETTVYCVNPKAPEPTHLLLRGNPGSPADVVTPGGIASLGSPLSEFGLAADAADPDRRRKLAEWIASPENPLFARVIVNRLWQYHFGRGLIASSNDFGFNGGLPTHPELLEWLASELVARNWSLKEIHRRIVLSATYRQSARSRPEAAERDAENRFLWRHMPQRLEAETLRDVMLAVSGELNPRVGGPPFQDFRTFTFNSQFYEMQDPVGPEFHRRTIYRTWIRSARSPLLDVFDCPDPSTTAPRRPVTTTPVQSLALLNNSFVLRMSEDLSALVAKGAPADPKGQVAEVYRRAYGRTPTEAEAMRAGEFVAAHGLPALCRAVFNSNEFLYVD